MALSATCPAIIIERMEVVVARTYLVIIIQIQQLSRPPLIHFLVTLSRSAHAQCRIHMHIMARQVKTYEPLK